MKKFRILLLSCIATALFVSCQKEFTIDDFDPPVIDPPVDSAILLKKYTRIDTLLSAPNDTIFTASYFYDNLNRCTTIRYVYFDHPLADDDEGVATETLSYSGTDTLVSSRIYTINYADGSTDSRSAYYTYNSAGLLMKDSMNYDVSRTVYTHRYDGNIIHSVSQFSNAPGDTIYYSRHHLVKVNGNITSEKDTAFDATVWPYAEYTITSYTGQYDTHPNPLYKMSSHWPVMFEAEHYFQSEFSNQQPNNFLLNSLFFGGTEDYTYQYTYLPNGYPSVARIHYVYPGVHDEYWKAVYQYY